VKRKTVFKRNGQLVVFPNAFQNSDLDLANGSGIRWSLTEANGKKSPVWNSKWLALCYEWTSEELKTQAHPSYPECWNIN